MLQRLRKRLESLIGSSGSEGPSWTATHEAEPDSDVASETTAKESPSPEDSAGKAPDSDLAAKLARREAERRESQLLLQQRIQNRSTTLMGELRSELLVEIHEALEQEAGAKNLKAAMDVALDLEFQRKLDTRIDLHTAKLVERLEEEFAGQTESRALFPKAGELSEELRTYRDEILRTFLLDRIEVFGLPSLAKVFPEGGVAAEQQKQLITAYFKSCQNAIDRIFDTNELATIRFAREGLRIPEERIRERLGSAQFKNAYRVLSDRLGSVVAKIAEIQMSSHQRLEEHRPTIDRQVVEEVIVPLAFFIRERTEPEPLQAMQARAELFREIIDKLVASGDPFNRTAEAVKPLLRRSIEQARPMARDRFRYLAPQIESLKPFEVHRATALTHMFETLLKTDLDEKALDAVEQNIRLNKSQYHIYEHLSRACPELVSELQPLDRFQPTDAEFFLKFLQGFEPSGEAIRNMARRLGYLEPVEEVSENPMVLIRAIAVLALPRQELTSWEFLYGATPPTERELEILAKTVAEQIRPTGVGVYDLQKLIEAIPVPVDLARALASAGYQPTDANRVANFREEVRRRIMSGEASELSATLGLLRRARRAVEEERRESGHVFDETYPYVGEIWLRESGELVGLLFYKGVGFGEIPLEQVVRKPSGGNHSEIEQSLRRLLTNQALIYQAFYKLFTGAPELSLKRRQSLPSYLKTTYEKMEPNRNTLLAHARNARLLLRRMEEFAAMILEANAKSKEDVASMGQILTGLSRKVDQIITGVDKTSSPEYLSRFSRELERITKYLNIGIVHSINPWLDRQTRELATQFEYRKEDVEAALKAAAIQAKLNWKEVVECKINPIRGTLGCRALIQLEDGSSRAAILEYDRQSRQWKVKHFAPTLIEIVREELRRHGRELPETYDEKFEQATFSLNEPSSRFMLTKKGIARVEATMVLDTGRGAQPWKVVYLRWNTDVLIDRTNPLAEPTSITAH